jgi:biotin/methionine sulfoxide reductase
MGLTSTHWGVYRTRTSEGRLVGLDPVEWDRDPSPLGRSMPEGVSAPSRIARPAIREGFLKHRGASREARGSEPFVEVGWDEAFDIVAEELQRVRRDFGNEAIYGGSYGWSSAGRFHHAQSQLNRFLRLIGGYTDSVDSYSLGAARVILRHVVAPWEDLVLSHTGWQTLEQNTELFVAFGGLPGKNTQVNPGGASEHIVRPALARMAAASVHFVNVSPVRADLGDVAQAEWVPVRPGSDTALMLGLAHVLVTENLYDRDFIERYAVGFETFRDYLLGHSDGVAKDADWAAVLTDIPAGRIRDLARTMASRRTMINVAWSLQRAEHGEQPYWMGITLAALLGQIGLPGGGFGVGYACMNSVGAGRHPFSGPRLPQGINPLASFIPVARVADMFLNPGQPYDYDGKSYRYPNIRLVYWAGGNIFHHHQDINKLIRAWRKPEVTIVHDAFWTAHAKFSDIVLPATTTLERNDIGSASLDRFMIAMQRAIEPFAEARDDYAIFSGIAARLGLEKAFTEGRSPEEWLRVLYEESRPRAETFGIVLPEFDRFWQEGFVDLPRPRTDSLMLDDFRRDPDLHPLKTPSGRLEIASQAIGSFGYEEIPPHPAWQPPAEWLGSPIAARYPLHLLSNQPRTRLHSQFDHGTVSRESKIQDREPLTMNPADAAARGLAPGAVVRVYNDRGAFLAGLAVSDDIRPGVVQIATGAWYDPVDRGAIGSLDAHGNPNLVTQDVGASRLSQGCAAQSVLVQVEGYERPLPPITAFDPPAFVQPNLSDIPSTP